MSLQLYLDNGWLRQHTTSRGEIASLLAIADRDLAQSQTPGLGPEWRFDIAYNAALQSATAALAAAGYRPERHNAHLRVIASLAFTIELDPVDVSLLDTCRRKRHASVYDRIGAISHGEADEMLELAKRLRSDVEQWLLQRHPGLMRD